jgi:hypothetical protein
MSRLRVFSLVFLAAFCAPVFHACEFDTAKVWDSPADQNAEPPVVDVVHLDLEQDSVWLLYGRDVSFRFSSSRDDIMGAEFLIDGEVSQTFYSDEGVFGLDYSGLSDGLHTLQLNVYTAAGTGSIADRLGLESYVFTKTWKLFVIKDYNTSLRTTVKDGCLSISWKEYPASDFKEFIIYREEGYNNRIVAGRNIVPEFTDCTYVGESASYYVEMVRKQGDPVAWGQVYLSPEKPALRFSANSSNEYTISWEKSKYYGAVSLYRLSMAAFPGIDYVTIKETSDPDDNSTRLPSSVRFADMVYFKLLVVPVNSPIYDPADPMRFESVLRDVETGFRFGPDGISLSQPEQAGPDDFLFIAGCDSLMRYSVAQKRITEKLSYIPQGCSMCRFGDYETSPSGQFLSTRFDCDYDLMLAETGNLKDYDRYELQSFSGQYNGSRVPISDAGTGLVNTGNEGFYVYDFNSSVVKGHYTSETAFAYGIAVSSGGNYLFVMDDAFRLVRFDDPGFTTIWTRTEYGLPAWYGFHGTDPDALVIWDGSVFSKRDCSDFSVEYSFPLTDEAVLHVDYYGNELLSYSEGHLFVRNLADGSLIADIPYGQNAAAFYYRPILVNHTVISNTGVMYFVN